MDGFTGSGFAGSTTTGAGFVHRSRSGQTMTAHTTAMKIGNPIIHAMTACARSGFMYSAATVTSVAYQERPTCEVRSDIARHLHESKKKRSALVVPAGIEPATFRV